MASCMLNCSPGPSPGAPLKSPIVSVTCPNPALHTCAVKSSWQLVPTEPTPDAKLTRLSMLNMSARNCSEKRSLIGMFLMTETSTSLKLGPGNLLRETGPPAHPGSGKFVTGFFSLGLQKAEGFNHCKPGTLGSNLLEPVVALPPRKFSPDNNSS